MVLSTRLSAPARKWQLAHAVCPSPPVWMSQNSALPRRIAAVWLMMSPPIGCGTATCDSGAGFGTELPPCSSCPRVPEGTGLRLTAGLARRQYQAQQRAATPAARAKLLPRAYRMVHVWQPPGNSHVLSLTRQSGTPRGTRSERVPRLPKCMSHGDGPKRPLALRRALRAAFDRSR